MRTRMLGRLLPRARKALGGQNGYHGLKSDRVSRYRLLTWAPLRPGTTCSPTRQAPTCYGITMSTDNPSFYLPRPHGDHLGVFSPAETHSCATLRTPSIRCLVRAHPRARRTEECELAPR